MAGKTLLTALLLSSSVGSAQATSNSGAQTSWTTALAEARGLVQQMTYQEMNSIVYGYYNTVNGCNGLSAGVPRLNFTGFCSNDGPVGPRAMDLVNAYPAGISTASSWNLSLAYDRALYMGAEFKRKGIHLAFAPVVAPLGRTAEGGRNWEGFGADPYLAGQMAAVTVQGMQQSVIATIKHFIGYEQELNRQPHGTVPSYSSNIDDRTMHEIYMWPFQDAVHAEVGCVMCSYNRINGTYGCQNNHTLNTLLKGELAFPGFVVSDFYAQQSSVPSALAGLDYALPLSNYWFQDKLANAVQNGTLPAARLRDMATRIVAAWYKVIGGPNSNFPAPGVGVPVNLLAPHKLVDARDPASKATILEASIQGHVLLKNTNNALPLKSPTMLSLYGYDAVIPLTNYPTSSPISFYSYGLESVNLTISQALAILTGGNITDVPQSAILGTLISGGGSGSGTPSFISDPYSALVQQAQVDDTFLVWDFKSLSPSVNPESDACLVFINEAASEGVDRPGLADPNSDTLVNNIARQCSNTIVVIHNDGIRVVDSWIQNPNVTALIFAQTPGQVSGSALVEILYGRSSPSGRLTYTVPKQASDFGTLLSPCPPIPANNPQCNFTEGELIDYRRFLSLGIEPRFPFGYGLTYGNFSYAGLTASFTQPNAPATPPNPTVVSPGGISSLFNTIAQASFKVTNTGAQSAAEVAQLYVQFPGDSNLRQLRGFQKVSLAPGSSAAVNLNLTRRDLSRWDVTGQSWMLQQGTYTIWAGPNVRDVTLQAKLTR